MIKKVGSKIKRGEKMHDNYIDSNKIKENKYKILRMSLILNAEENKNETLTSFEESAREIDAMNDETYLTEIESKFYDTLKLEEEEAKLAELVDYIGGRVDQRISLLSDFANITGYDLTNLPQIKYYDKLDDYKDRLKYIREYLGNTNKINSLTEEIESSEQSLNEAHKNKKLAEERNAENEENLFNKFISIIKPLASLKDITPDNIDAKLNEVISSVIESKKSLDIFNKSYTTLKGSGISREEEAEYKTYVDNAKELYYSNKEEEYLLRLYQLLFVKENEYNQLTLKRCNINDILNERADLRRELSVDNNDILAPLYDTLDIQYKDIEEQRNNIETIDYLSNLILQKTEERNSLEEANQKVEILSLLREFCIIDAYVGLDDTNVDLEIEENTFKDEDLFVNDNTNIQDISFDNTKEEEIIIPEDIISKPSSNETLEEDAKDNQVIKVEPATGLDLDLIHSKASKVMKRVGEMLGIKTEETKIVNVVSDETKEEKETVEEIKEPVSDSTIEEIVITNPFTNEEVKEESTEEINPLFETNENANETNPLFGEIVTSNEVNPLFEGSSLEDETPADPEDSNFWFSSDMPDALNELPDLEVSNDNFFGDNNMPELNFPDLNFDFGNNDMESDK